MAKRPQKLLTYFFPGSCRPLVIQLQLEQYGKHFERRKVPLHPLHDRIDVNGFVLAKDSEDFSLFGESWPSLPNRLDASGLSSDA
jgi:hypothetical protein